MFDVRLENIRWLEKEKPENSEIRPRRIQVSVNRIQGIRNSEIGIQK